MAGVGFLGAPRLLLLFIFLLSLSHCSPVTSDIRRISQESPPRGKRQGGYFSVLGVAGLGGSSLHPRLEIRELEKNADQWNIYLLGLRRLQSVDQGDKLSYYQVAGMSIGTPVLAYDGP
jgi:tyrosinase